MRLKDKRVIVTGGTTGIGAAICSRFLEEGAHVVVWGQNPGNTARIARELPGLSGVATVDVAETTGVDDAFKQSLETLGGLDVLICNAGISIRRNFVDMSPDGPGLR